MENKFIPVYQPDLSGNEKKYVMDCLESSWVSSKGSYIPKFESDFAKYIGVRYATGCCNGTTALHLAMLSCGIGKDDEVIVPSFTYVAAVNAITYVGASPVFADSERRTWQIDPDEIEGLITAKTKAILAVHLYGHACNMDALCRIAKKHKVLLIEDCAEAFGTYYKGKHVGLFGDMGTFSFFGNKTITTGEGGMVVSNDLTLINRAKSFKGQGLAAYREYWHDLIGYNYRMTNIQAAIGCAQLEKADLFLKRKREIAEIYKANFENLPIEFHEEEEGTVHSYWMVTILVETPNLRDELRVHLKKKGIETRPAFYPVHTMPIYANKFRRLPIAEELSQRGINLPSWPKIPSMDVDIVLKEVRNFYVAEVATMTNSIGKP